LENGNLETENLERQAETKEVRYKQRGRVAQAVNFEKLQRQWKGDQIQQSLKSCGSWIGALPIGLHTQIQVGRTEYFQPSATVCRYSVLCTLYSVPTCYCIKLPVIGTLSVKLGAGT
jgi:hypothetical protein